MSRLVLIIALLLGPAGQTALAAPGAHGPDGEHLDAAPRALAAHGEPPRFETLTERFELVGRLQDDGLSLLINRFETSEPVLEARIDIAIDDRTATARFRADPGDFVLDDHAVLDALRLPGDHPLVISVFAGEDSDLLDAILRVPAPDITTEAGQRQHWLAGLAALIALATLIALAVLARAAWRTVRARRRSKPDSAIAAILAPFLVTPATLLVLSFGAAAIVPTAARAAPGAHGPNGEHLDAAPATAAGGLRRLPDGSVNVPILAQRRLGVRTRIAVASAAHATVELTGRIVMDPNAGGLVQPGQGGRVEAGPRGFPVVGQAVSQGEILGWVRHLPDPYARAGQQGQLTQLRADRQLAAQRLRRLESLAGTVARKEIEAARADLASLVDHERRIDASLSDREPLAAPVSGVIVRAAAVAGLVVEPRERLFEIVDPTRLMVEAVTADPTLPDRLADAFLHEAPGARLTMAGAGRALRDGVLPLMFRLRSVVEGQALPLSPPLALPLALDQPVTLIARLAERLDGYVLPARAVVRNAANEPVVWIKSGAERFIPQSVRYQMLDATTVVVLAGLGADNRVAVEGASLLAQIR